MAYPYRFRAVGHTVQTPVEDSAEMDDEVEGLHRRHSWFCERGPLNCENGHAGH